MTVDLYDPLTYDNLMAGMVLHFEKQTLEPLDTIEVVSGPGIYSLFYSGNLPIYDSISGSESPIYVGKAIPPGSRKGEDVDESKPALRSRIREHARSIGEVRNLEVSDFSYRYLVVVPVWITLAERFLIDHYKPIWNLCLDGFGDHDPGSGRRNSQRSWWDTLHPGRKWADRLAIGRKTNDAEKMVRDFFLQTSEGQM